MQKESNIFCSLYVQNYRISNSVLAHFVNLYFLSAQCSDVIRYCDSGATCVPTNEIGNPICRYNLKNQQQRNF